MKIEYVNKEKTHYLCDVKVGEAFTFNNTQGSELYIRIQVDLKHLSKEEREDTSLFVLRIIDGYARTQTNCTVFPRVTKVVVD